MTITLQNPDGDSGDTTPSGTAVQPLPDFDVQWHAVRQQVWIWCRRAAGNQDDAQDLFQQIAFRAWRGYATFRGDASFLTWTLAIARRMTAYELGQRGTRQRREASLEYLQVNAPAALPAVEAPALPVDRLGWLPQAVQAARASEELTDNEGAVLLLRLQMPEAGWGGIGTVLGLSETACAVLHCRAVPKLRVFLFRQRPEMLGGLEAIAQAFELAKETPDDALDAAEAEAFRRLVLEQDQTYRRAGWRSALRTACEKVIRRMSVMI